MRHSEARQILQRATVMRLNFVLDRFRSVAEDLPSKRRPELSTEKHVNVVPTHDQVGDLGSGARLQFRMLDAIFELKNARAQHLRHFSIIAATRGSDYESSHVNLH